jgi:hypothetical protein
MFGNFFRKVTCFVSNISKIITSCLFCSFLLFYNEFVGVPFMFSLFEMYVPCTYDKACNTPITICNDYRYQIAYILLIM